MKSQAFWARKLQNHVNEGKGKEKKSAIVGNVLKNPARKFCEMSSFDAKCPETTFTTALITIAEDHWR